MLELFGFLFFGFIGHSYEVGKLKRVEAGLKSCRNIYQDWFERLSYTTDTIPISLKFQNEVDLA